jgi:hypothetical protein
VTDDIMEDDELAAAAEIVVARDIESRFERRIVMNVPDVRKIVAGPRNLAGMSGQ